MSNDWRSRLVGAVTQAKEGPLKIRDSAMPAEKYSESLFDVPLVILVQPGDPIISLPGTRLSRWLTTRYGEPLDGIGGTPLGDGDMSRWMGY